MTNEQCWVIWGKRLGFFWVGKMEYLGEGEPSMVSFDNSYVIKNLKNLIGFWHTHPQWTADYSSMDDHTMAGWNVCVGKPLLCAIKGTDRVAAWWSLDEESPMIELKLYRVGQYVFGWYPW